MPVEMLADLVLVVPLIFVKRSLQEVESRLEIDVYRALPGYTADIKDTGKAKQTISRRDLRTLDEWLLIAGSCNAPFPLYLHWVNDLKYPVLAPYDLQEDHSSLDRRSYTEGAPT